MKNNQYLSLTEDTREEDVEASQSESITLTNREARIIALAVAKAILETKRIIN